jgi:hypothetical protein
LESCDSGENKDRWIYSGHQIKKRPNNKWRRLGKDVFRNPCRNKNLGRTYDRGWKKKGDFASLLSNSSGWLQTYECRQTDNFEM